MTPFVLYAISVKVVMILLFVFTGLYHFPRETINFVIHLLIFSYVVLIVAVKEIRFSSHPINQNMTIFSWAGYLSFGFFVKLMFTALLTTLIVLFAYLFPALFDLLIKLVQNQSLQIEKSNFANTLMLFIYAGVFAPVWEELFFRGILLRKFMTRYSAMTSIVLSSLLFAIFHGGLFSIVNAFIIGCFFAYIYIIKRNIWILIIIHSINNIVSLLLSELSSPVDPSAFEGLSSYKILLQDLVIPVIITMALLFLFIFLFMKGYRNVQSVSFK